MSTAVAEARRAQVNEIRVQLDSMMTQFSTVLPPQIKPEKFVRVVITAVQNNADLLEADRRTFFNACMKCATDGLVPDGRKAALVIFKDRTRGKVVQYMPMIAGLREKVRNSGEVVTWEAHCVFEHDAFTYEEGDQPILRHVPKIFGERGQLIGAYSVARFRTGDISREFMRADEIEKVRAVSRAESGPWQSWYEEMCRKTVARRHSKVLPMSEDVEALFRRDDEIARYDDPPRAPAALSAPLPVDETAGRPRTLNDQLNRLAGAPLPPSNAPAADAAAEEDFGEPFIDGKALDEEPAHALTRHAQALSAAAKESPLALASAWARIPKDAQEQLRDTYESLQAPARQEQPTA